MRRQNRPLAQPFMSRAGPDALGFARIGEGVVRPVLQQPRKCPRSEHLIAILDGGFSFQKRGQVDRGPFGLTQPELQDARLLRAAVSVRSSRIRASYAWRSALDGP